ncbi:imidazole glycerol phosphate synthase subunit HisH [Gammaproteobacteria bacterium]|jgi:imidazole glycerol-phosphate synthase subunit HisH|nr:imidazole glycerol phosphate synthase subunit HisH [Gammaproteobacteria bacterium]
MKVDIVDVGSGNVRSIKNWVEKCNVDARLVHRVDDLASEVIILPGVGSAGPYMDRLRKSSFDYAITDHVQSGGRLIGICLGFQIMSSFSEEDGGIEGLSLIDAQVERLEKNASHNEWEPFALRKDQMNGQSFSSSEKLSRKTILNGRVFYNHEYGVINNDSQAFTVPASLKMHQYSGMLVKDKIIGIQFHPEKSQLTGLELISMML